jgi:nitronate monooxygenase
MAHPVIIQGGMGAGVSNWKLARTVSKLGHLGLVSCTALDVILARRLQDGDKDGLMRKAIANFPIKEIADRVLDRYFVEGGIGDFNYRQVPMYQVKPNKDLVELVILANFVEVFLAKEGHDGIVGVNLLEKIQMPTVHSLYGAMLAGVDYVIMGAGIPREIPGILDKLAKCEDVAMKLQVDGAEADEFKMEFSPKEFMGDRLKELKRPYFFPIVSSNILAITLVKKSTGKVDGLIIEGPTAGGHNAPPRVKGITNDSGEPIYGDKDFVDIEKIKKLGIPFWLAGGYGFPDKLQEALDKGATGVQVGTAFAFTEESGFVDAIKKPLIKKAKKGEGKVFTDMLASPTGFPFKVVSLEGSLSEPEVYEKRPRICNIGCLRQIYKKDNGEVGYICAAEPEKSYIEKGGNPENLKGRKCLCNALVANVGHPKKYKNGYKEQYLVTVGDCFNNIVDFLKSPDDEIYKSQDVVDKLLTKKD